MFGRVIAEKIRLSSSERQRPSNNQHNFEWSFRPIGILIELMTGFQMFYKKNSMSEKQASLLSTLIHRSLMLLVAVIHFIFSYRHQVNSGNLSITRLGNMISAICFFSYSLLIPLIFFTFSFNNDWNLLWKCFEEIEKQFNLVKNLNIQKIITRCRRVSFLVYFIILEVK